MEPEIRNSLPGILQKLQGWMESPGYLRRVLGLESDASIGVLRVRRNFKFRKLLIRSGSLRYVCYIHYLPRGLRNLGRLHNLAAEVGVNTPRPIISRTSWHQGLLQGGFSVVLPYLPGKTLSNSCSTLELELLGETLGKLHSIRSRHHGPLVSDFRSLGNYWETQCRYWDKAQIEIAGYKSQASSDLDNVTTSLKQSGKFLDGYNNHSLLHGDPASGNFLQQPDGSLCLIDCDRINYAPAPTELARALLEGYCAHYPERQGLLVESYLRHCPADIKTLWEQHARFFIASALFWRVQRKLQWDQKRSDIGRSRERAELAWRQLLDVTASSSNNWESLLPLLGD